MPEHYEMKLQKGDVVRLAQEITVEEFGLSLCDDDGTPIEIDAEVLDVGKVYLRVKIMRMMRLTRLTAPQEMAVTRFVRAVPSGYAMGNKYRYDVPVLG